MFVVSILTYVTISTNDMKHNSIFILNDWDSKRYDYLQSLERRVVKDKNGKYRNQLKIKDWVDVRYTELYGSVYITKYREDYDSLEELERHLKIWYEELTLCLNHNNDEEIINIDIIRNIEDKKNQEVIDRVGNLMRSKGSKTFS